MKRIFLFVGMFVVSSVFIEAQISLNGLLYQIDTIMTYPAGPGADYLQTRMCRADNGTDRLDVYILRVDLTNPYVHLEEALGTDKLIGTERPTAIAKRKSTPQRICFGGTNGDFFDTGIDRGCPVGLTVQNNEYARIGSTSRRFGGVTEEGKIILGNQWKYKGELFYADDAEPLQIAHVNYTRNENELVLYNQHNGTTTGTNDYGTEVVVELLPEQRWTTNGTMRLRVQQVVPSTGNTAIPAGQAVLSGHGTMAAALANLKVGQEVEVRFSFVVDGVETALAQCVGGDNYALIVHDGQVEHSNFWNERHPRTGFGGTQSGDTAVFCVVDGRGASMGCTTKVLGEIMHYYGAWNAVNWDGGGSSCLFLDQFGQVNHGSDGSERACGNAMLAVAELPEADTEITRIVPYDFRLSLPRYGVYSPRFLGYNKYGLLVDTDVAGITLSCDAGLGEILDDGRLLASGDEGGLLTATLGTASITLPVSLIATAPVSFKMDSLLMDNRHACTIDVESMVNGQTIELKPEALQWISKDESVVIVSASGIISAVGNGRTMVVGSLGDLSDTLIVRVENPEKKEMIWEDWSDGVADWKLTAVSDLKARMQQTDEQKGGLSVMFDYSAGRQRYIKLEHLGVFYGLPDSVRIVFRTDAVFDFLMVTMGTADAERAEGIKYQIQETDGNVILQFAPKDFFAAFTAASYPVTFKSLYFALATSNTAATHTIALQNISLLYNGVIENALEQTVALPFRVYPNPVTDVLCVESDVQNEMLTLTNMQGTICLTQPVLQPKTIVNMVSLPRGVYMLSLGGYSVKILKQ